MQIPKHIPQFDFLRGVAVLMVMVFHASHDVQSFPMGQFVSFGWAGVDLFFVLSGFLITGILSETRDRKGYFINFYARRILRIWPLYYALLGIMFLAVPVLAPRWNAAAMGSARPAWAFVLFVQNLVVGHMTGPLSPTWSLAIEEQFYFVWPLLIWILPRRTVKHLAAALVVCSPLLRLGLMLGHVQISVYYNTLTRLDGLAVGSFLALWLPDANATTVKRRALAALPIALAGAVFLEKPWLRYSAISIAAGAVVCLSFFLTYRSRFVLFTGRISYGLYLIHMAVFGLATKPELRRHYPHSPILNDIAYLAVGTLLTYGFASMSWFLFESQILRAKKWFASPPATERIGIPGPGTSISLACAAIADNRMEGEIGVGS